MNSKFYNIICNLGIRTVFMIESIVGECNSRAIVRSVSMLHSKHTKCCKIAESFVVFMGKWFLKHRVENLNICSMRTKIR